MSNIVMLKRAFNQAIATGAVSFTDKETDFLVIKRFITDYAARNNVDIDASEIEAFIKAQQENMENSSTVIVGEGTHIEVEHVAAMDKPDHMTKEQVLADGFAEASSNPAVRFVDTDIDFLVIKEIMMEYAQRWNMEVTEEEVVDYMKDQFHKMHLAIQDFSHNFNAMK